MPASGSDLVAVEVHLDNWARWMRSREGVQGLPRASLGFVSGSLHFEDLCDAADLTAARATNALVEGLQPSQKAAVEHTYLGVVWRFPRNNLEALLAAAYEALGQGMSRRGLI